VNDDGDPLELLKVLGQRLPGWLDDIIIEAFWFDGTEVAGTYEFNFLFHAGGPLSPERPPGCGPRGV
jgi:hypothetical protein